MIDTTEEMNEFLIKIGVVILSFILPIIPVLILVMFISLVDYHYGIKASKKEGKKITSNRMRRTVSKIIEYFIATLLIFGMGNLLMVYLVGYAWWINVAMILGTFIYVIIPEAKSIDENLIRINGKGLKHKFNDFMKLFRFLKSNVNEIKDGIDEIKEEK